MPIRIARRPQFANILLIVGVILYIAALVLVGPSFYGKAHGQTSPPTAIEPLARAVLPLWLAPICLSALFDSPWSIRSRVVSLSIYAGLFIFVFGTPLLMSRYAERLEPSGILKVIVIVLAAETIMQLLLGRVRKLVDDPELSRSVWDIPRRVWAAGLAIVLLAVAFPFALRPYIVHLDRMDGRRNAEIDWDIIERAGHWRQMTRLRWREPDLQIGNARVTYRYNPDTGLPIHRFNRTDEGWIEGYNTRVDELLAERGTPGWAMDVDFPTPEEMIALLDDPAGEEITAFPLDVTPNILLVHGKGRFNRWEHSVENHQENYGIFTYRHPSSVAPWYLENRRAYVLATEPLVIIRIDDHWLGVYHPDGRILAQVERGELPTP